MQWVRKEDNWRVPVKCWAKISQNTPLHSVVRLTPLAVLKG